MKALQPCNTCAKCKFEQGDPEYFPPGYGVMYCYYTDKNIPNEIYESGECHQDCPLLINSII